MLNKCDNFLKNASPSFLKEVLVIQKIKYRWEEMMKALQKKGYNEKGILNAKEEMAKLKDLEFLTNCLFHGPINSKRAVTQYLSSEEENENKRNHSYYEIRYVKATLINLPQASPLSKLHSQGKYLPIQQYADNLA